MNHALNFKAVRWAAMSIADKTAAITTLVQAGQSTGQMGAALGATRNMILSHARRYGVKLASPLPKRLISHDAKLRSVKQMPEARRSDRLNGELRQPVPASTWDAHREPVSLMELQEGQCRWPVGESSGAQQMFCGEDMHKRGYCERHHGTGYRRYDNGAKIAQFPV